MGLVDIKSASFGNKKTNRFNEDQYGRISKLEEPFT